MLICLRGFIDKDHYVMVFRMFTGIKSTRGNTVALAYHKNRNQPLGEYQGRACRYASCRG